MSFYIDSKLDVRYTTGLPSGEIGLLVNTWFPDWLPGRVPARSSAVYVDRIRHRHG